MKFKLLTQTIFLLIIWPLSDFVPAADPRVIAPANLENSANYEFGIELNDDDFIVEENGEILNIKWFDNAKARGINTISFELFTRDAKTLFKTPSLLNAGFKTDPDVGNLFPAILKEAKKRDMKIIIMLETISHIVYHMKPYSAKISKHKLTPGWTAQLITEIADEAKKYGTQIGIDEEAFPDTYMDAIKSAAQKNNIEYAHFFEDLKCRPDMFISEDYAYYPRDAGNNRADIQYLKELYRSGGYYGKLGYLDIMFGTGIGCNIKTAVATAGGWGMGPKTHQNIALFRAVQYNPKFYMFIIGEGESENKYPREEEHVQTYNFNTLKPLLIEFAKKPTDIPKRMANLIIDKPTRGSEDLVDTFTDALLSSSDAITNALNAAGYTIIVTTQPVKADLYYILTPGSVFGEDYDLSNAIIALLKNNQPVFFQAIGGIPDLQNWNKAAKALAITSSKVIVNDDQDSYYDPIPETIEYEFPSGKRFIKYRGYSFEANNENDLGKFSYGHHFNKLKTKAEVLLETDTPVMIKNKNFYFINGGYIHFEFSNVLANIISDKPIYNKLSYGYFSNGESRSVFYSPYDTDIDINLMLNGNVTEFDMDGNRLKNSSLKVESRRLIGKTRKFHLYIIK